MWDLAAEEERLVVVEEGGCWRKALKKPERKNGRCVEGAIVGCGCVDGVGGTKLRMEGWFAWGAFGVARERLWKLSVLAEWWLLSTEVGGKRRTEYLGRLGGVHSELARRKGSGCRRLVEEQVGPCWQF